MVYAVLLASLAAFLQTLKFTGLISHVKAAAANLLRAFRVIKNTAMSENEKEAAIQAATLKMFALCFGILIRTAAALAVALFLVFVSIRAGFITIADLETALTDKILLALFLATTPLMWRITK